MASQTDSIGGQDADVARDSASLSAYPLARGQPLQFIGGHVQQIEIDIHVTANLANLAKTAMRSGPFARIREIRG